MTVTIMQPAYLPWLGYFERVLLSDLFVVLDDVQMDASSKTNFVNRNKIRTSGEPAWLTVPIRKKGLHQNLFINRIEIDRDSKWQVKHWNSLKMNYSRSAYFVQHASYFEAAYKKEWSLLVDLIHNTNHHLFEVLGIATKRVLHSSDPADGKKDDLILNICKKYKATRYISGPFGRTYLDLEKFRRAGIDVFFHYYKHPRYRQRYPGFESYLSVVDLLFNEGPESLKILNTTADVRNLLQ
ncbi:MAG: WbqC family protein [Bacteroidota bacterium]